MHSSITFSFNHWFSKNEISRDPLLPIPTKPLQIPWEYFFTFFTFFVKFDTVSIHPQFLTINAWPPLCSNSKSNYTRTILKSYCFYIDLKETKKLFVTFTAQNKIPFCLAFTLTYHKRDLVMKENLTKALVVSRF